MDNFRGMYGVRRIDRMRNGRIRNLFTKQKFE